jgi:hypothetical protein
LALLSVPVVTLSSGARPGKPEGRYRGSAALLTRSWPTGVSMSTFFLTSLSLFTFTPGQHHQGAESHANN